MIDTLIVAALENGNDTVVVDDTVIAQTQTSTNAVNIATTRSSNSLPSFRGLLAPS